LYLCRKRFGITYSKICGESGSVLVTDVNKCRALTHEKLGRYEACDIYNCDETALYWKCLPNRTLTQPVAQVEGRKRKTDRVTLLLCANADGSHKLKPLVIGKFANPRCFNNVDFQSFDVDYCANQKAWMTGDIFRSWVKELDRRMSTQGRNIALVLDNASSHPKLDPEEILNVELVFLVANTSSICQPLDQGIIQNLKTLYRKRVLHKLMDEFQGNAGTKLDVNLREALEWLNLSWKDVKKETIANCFLKSRILP
jgi:hypothetical protein